MPPRAKVIPNGTRFGRLVVESLEDFRKDNRLCYACKCDCGRLVRGVMGRNLTRGLSSSCGCFNRQRVTETKGTNYIPGEFVGKFIILEKVESKGKLQRYRVFDLDLRKECVRTTAELHLVGLPGLSQVLRKRLREAVRKYRDGKKTRLDYLLKCDMETFVSHLGRVPREDECIDHICPLSQAKTEEEVYRLFHYSNLRVVQTRENNVKHTSKTTEGEELCTQLLEREWIDKSTKE